MYEHEHGQFKFYSAQDMRHHYELQRSDPEWPEIHRGHLEYMFTKRGMFVELFAAWGRAFNLEGYKILDAHGNFEDGGWNYYQNDRSMGRVQNWVSSHDGTATALMVTSCNPQGNELVSNQSLVLYTSRLVGSLPAMVYTRGLIRLYIPSRGHMERQYKQLRNLINELSVTL